MFAISTNEERYDGQYKTLKDAVDEAMNGYGYEVFWVGECVAPTQPEDWWEASDWLEHVHVQDEYCGEWAEDWNQSTKQQRHELEDQVRKVMADWLDRHKLRPTFFNIANPVKYVVSDGVAEPQGEASKT